jgi:CRP/FNR family transcriptional regulator, anaerobic regulatory protein
MHKKPDKLIHQMMEDAAVHRFGDFERLLGMPASSESLCELQKYAVRKTFEPGQAIFWEGDRSDFVYKLLNGAVKGYKLLSNGRSQIARFAISGDLLGHPAFDSYAYTAEALSRCDVMQFPKKRFDQIVEQDPQLRRAIGALLAQELHETQKQVLLLGRMAAMERVSQFLVDFAERARTSARAGNEHSANLVELPMTRSDIADYLGLTIETVSRIFSRFRRGGLIELPKPNVIRFRDPTRFQGQTQDLAA